MGVALIMDNNIEKISGEVPRFQTPAPYTVWERHGEYEREIVFKTLEEMQEYLTVCDMVSKTPC